jgi:homoserine dehydrogenase
LAEAQRLGMAERDPTADVEGHDAAAKAAILAALAFGSDVVDADVHREGISGIRAVDVAYANRLGYSVKLLAVAELVDGGPELSVRVHPAMVPKGHPLASVRGAFNAVFIEGAASGELMLYGRGAGGGPTASAVLGDLVDAARNQRAGAPAPAPKRASIAMRSQSDLQSAFYLSMDVADRPGVLAAVAKVFGDHQVSIRSMEQVGLFDEARLIFLTHPAREGDLLATIDELRLLKAVDRVSGVLRVIAEGEA